MIYSQFTNFSKTNINSACEIICVNSRMIAVLLLAAIPASLQAIAYVNTNTCTKSGLGYSYVDFQSWASYLVTVEVKLQNQFISYEPVGQPKVQYGYTVSSNNYLTQIRGAQPSLYQSGNFLTFDSASALVHSNFNASGIKSLNFSQFGSQYSVWDICYGASLKEVFVLGTLSTTYSFWIFNNSLSPSVVKNLTTSSGIQKDKMICRDNRIYLTFESKIEVYSLDSSLNLLYSSSFPAAVTSQMDISVNAEILAYSYNNVIQTLNHSTLPFQPIQNYTFGSNITSIELVGSFLVFSNGSALVQYDYEINSTISTVASMITNFPQKIYNFNNSGFSVGKDLMLSPFNDKYLYYYSLDQSYPCPNCSVCYPSYTYDPSTQSCHKTSNITTNTNSNNTNNNTNIGPINTSTNNITNTDNNGNNNRNELDEQEGGPVQDIDTVLRSTFKMLKQQYNNTLALNGLSTVLVFSSIKLSPQFILSLWLVFDDIFYYSYHANQYPYSVQFFFNKIDIIVRDRLDPWFLQIVDVLNYSTTYQIDADLNMNYYLGIRSLESKPVLFTRSLVENYRNSLCLTLLIFVSLKTFMIFLLLLNLNSTFLRPVYRFAARNSQWWLAASSLLEGYISKACFDLGVQMYLPSCRRFDEKLNLVCSFFFSFIMLSYTFCFYPILYCSKSRRQAKMVLMPCKYSKFSFFYQPLLILTRTSLRSYIHSSFLRNYILQMFVLFATDLACICLCLKMRKFFHNFFIFTNYLVYLSGFAVFDLFFYLQSTQLLTAATKRELFGLIALGLIIGSSILITLTFFMSFLASILKFCAKKFKNPRIENEEERDKNDHHHHHPLQNNFVSTLCPPATGKHKLFSGKIKKKDLEKIKNSCKPYGNTAKQEIEQAQMVTHLKLNRNLLFRSKG